MLTGKRFRLPTEAQWVFTARGGNLGKNSHNQFAGSFDIYDVAWYDESSKNKTHPVGELYANELGLYDMSGNVWEWCYDWFDPDYYLNSPKNNPTGATSGKSHINRGGSWRNNSMRCRVLFRGFGVPTDAGNNMGLRLAL